MPRKVRQLIAELKAAGFIDRGGRGSHRNFLHPKGVRLTLSGHPGADAKAYQEREVARTLERLKDDGK